MFNLFKYSLVSVLTLGLFSTPTFAQDSDEDADVEEVIVTGSRIGRSEYSGINPVTLITSEDIEASGQLNISEVLRSGNKEFEAYRRLPDFTKQKLINPVVIY